MNEKTLQFILAAFAAIEQLAKAIPAIMDIVRSARATLGAMQSERRDPTPEEWDALNTQIKAAMDKLNS